MALLRRPTVSGLRDKRQGLGRRRPLGGLLLLSVALFRLNRRRFPILPAARFPRGPGPAACPLWPASPAWVPLRILAPAGACPGNGESSRKRLGGGGTC